MSQFAADENLNGTLLKGITQRLPELDIVRVQDTEMYQAVDPELLAWLAQQNRVLLTHDVQTIPGYANARVKDGLKMPGVIIVRETVTMGQLLDELEIILGVGTPEDFESIVRYVPM